MEKGGFFFSVEDCEFSDFPTPEDTERTLSHSPLIDFQALGASRNLSGKIGDDMEVPATVLLNGRLCSGAFWPIRSPLSILPDTN